MELQSSHFPNQQYHPIIVRPEPAGQFTAQPLGVPEIRVTASSVQAALEKAQAALARWSGSIHWLAVASNGSCALHAAGHAKDDPDFDQYLEEIERYRREADECECSNSSSTPIT